MENKEYKIKENFKKDLVVDNSFNLKKLLNSHSNSNMKSSNSTILNTKDDYMTVLSNLDIENYSGYVGKELEFSDNSLISDEDNTGIANEYHAIFTFNFKEEIKQPRLMTFTNKINLEVVLKKYKFQEYSNFNSYFDFIQEKYITENEDCDDFNYITLENSYPVTTNINNLFVKRFFDK